MPSAPETFIAKLLPHARRYQERYGLPGCVAIAQAALETGWGRAIKGNNLFGIKDRPGGGRQTFTTHEYVGGKRVRVVDAFEAFPSVDAAFDELAELLMTSRYAPVRAVAHDPEAFADALQRCGYATDPAYATKLKAILRKWRLAERLPPPARRAAA